MPSKIKLIQKIILVVLIFVLAACGEKNPNSGFGTVTAHPAGWNVSHKAAANANILSCVPCHGDDFKGGLSKVNCNGCHPTSISATSVHLPTWGKLTYVYHRAFVNMSGVRSGQSNCAIDACHGTNLDGGGIKVACTKCHFREGERFFNHDSAWRSNYTEHAKALRKKAAEGNNEELYPTCKASRCHGPDLKGVFHSGKDCYECHPETTTKGAFINHTESWGATLKDVRENHGGHVVMTNRASCGTIYCHGINFEGVRNSGQSCTSCHSADSHSKHPVSWAGYEKQGVPSHGKYVKVALGSVITSCKTEFCHNGYNAQGVTQPVNSPCSNCHSNLPNNGPNVSCKACHTWIETSEHPVENLNTWTNDPIDGHGKYLRTNKTASNTFVITSCTLSLCHGANERGVVGGGTDCLKCHITNSTNKHPGNWGNSFPGSDYMTLHSVYITSRPAFKCSTEYCHRSKNGLTFGPYIAKQTSRYDECDSCHSNGRNFNTIKYQ